MKNVLKRLSIPVATLFLLSWVISSATYANAGPRKGGGGGTHSVAEPATIALLGVGLVSLGLYANRKKGKK